FTTHAIRKVDQAAEEAKVHFEWASRQAIVSSKQTRVADHALIIVEDEIGWKKVEKGVERAMRENKTSILVKLMLRYKKKGGTNVVISDNKEPDLKKVHMIQYY